jgi:hypothetical protein
VPAGFVRLPVCLAYRCYRVPRPTASVASAVPGILASIGARPRESGPRGCSNPDPRHAVICRYQGVVERNTVEVWLSTYVDCRRKRCQATGDSRVDVWPP